MKMLRITTDSGGNIMAIVENSIGAVNLLRALARKGIKCIRWEMEA